ncbi:MAG TPA: wax ester/triacylglycerol synthase family O-acyltransferase [Acidimicrobiales bacterium]|nr:wax ester/triacylglycerol synthase family O-acyltransferase [Acidimicrobiales bacterium]
MTGLDASFLYNETPTLHMHTLKYTVLDVSSVPGGYDFERFQHELERRLHLLPPFRRRVVEVPGGLHHPVWIEDPDFDLGYHVRRIGVPPPGGREQMDAVIADIASWPLDRSKPLWEIWMLEGLEGGRVGFLAKVHHSVADGVAAAAMLANVMTTSAEDVDPPPPLIPWRPEPVPSRFQLVLDALRDLIGTLVGLPALLGRTAEAVRRVARHRKTAEVTTPRPILDTANTPFNGALTPHRSFATSTIPLDDVKAAKNALGVTINDIVLAMVAGSLRAWLQKRNALPERALVAGVPVSTDDPDGVRRLGGNRVSNMFTTLATDIDDPVARLRAIHDVTSAAKEMHNLLGADMLADWSEYTPPRPYAWFMRQYSRFGLAEKHRPPINVVVSNVAGPRDPLFVAGAKMEGIYSVGPILEGIGLNITVWSYGDQLNVGVIACREHIPDPHEITDGMALALDELLSCGGIPMRDRVGGTA